jgi:hypothetical protein
MGFKVKLVQLDFHGKLFWRLDDPGLWACRYRLQIRLRRALMQKMRG